MKQTRGLNLKEAVKSGKSFKRSHWKVYIHEHELALVLSREDLFALDYELDVNPNEIELYRYTLLNYYTGEVNQTEWTSFSFEQLAIQGDVIKTETKKILIGDSKDEVPNSSAE